MSCPTTAPQAGARCTVEGASCGPSCELAIVCRDGVWRWLRGQCPVCASPDTRIATPTGDRAIAELRPGDLVYSVDNGAILAVPVLEVGSTPVAAHWVMRVVLSSGAVLDVSPGHPTGDGREFGDLTAGDSFDVDHAIVSADLVPYFHDRTYDILPASSTGTYFSAGVLVGSTLCR